MANDNVDYYELLGVERDASGDQIKRAYYKLARKYHPDTNSDPESQSKFKTINDAYHVLKDPELRSKYDKYGIDGLDKEVFFDFSEEDFNEFLDIANLSEEDFLNEEKEKKKAKKLEKKEARKKQKEEQKKKKEEKKQKSKKDKQYADVDLTDVDVGFTPVPEQEPSFYTDQSSYNSNEEVDADYSNVNDLGDVNVVFDSPSSSDYPQSEDSSYSDYYQGYSQSPEYSDVVSDQEQYQNLNQNEQSSFDNSYESWQADDGYAQQGTEFAADNLDSQENFNNSDLNDDLGQVDYGYDGSSSVQQPESFSVESPSPVENDNLNFSGLTSDGNESDSSRTVASNYDNISNMNENPEYVSEENVSYSKNIEDVKDGDLSFTKSVNFSENVVDKNNVDSIRDEKNESTVSVNKEDMIAQREKSLPNFDFDKIIEHLNKEAQKNKELLSEMQKNSKNKDLQKINDFYSRPDVFSVQNTSEISEISSKQQIKGSKIKSLILRSDDVEEPTDILALELFNKDDQKNLTKQIVTQQIRDYYDNLFAELSKEKIQDQSISAKIERTKQISDVELNEDLDIYIKIKIPQIFAFSKILLKKLFINDE